MGNGPKEKDSKVYVLKGSTGKNHKYKIKTWGKCTVIKIKTHGKVAISSEKDCPFENWFTDCTQFSKQMRPIAKAFARLEDLHQVYMFIFLTGKRSGLKDDGKKAWDDAVGGWGNEFDVKVKKMKNQKDYLLKRRDNLCLDFYNNKILPLIEHALDAKTPARLDGSRRHDAENCNWALAEIPAIFFHSTIGREFALDIAHLLHINTYKNHSKDKLAKLLFSNYQNASSGDLLDSTVFESTLQLMDHFLPALDANPAVFKNPNIKLESKGFIEFLKGKRLKTMAVIDLTDQVIPRNSKIITHQVIKFNVEVDTIERADTLKCVALSNVLNLLGFMSAIDNLGKDKSFYSKVKGVKATAEFMSSFSKLSELAKIQAFSKAAGVVGLGLEGGLSVWDASKQINLSSSYDDRTLLAGSHLLKAVGAALMLYTLPVGAAVYLLGTLGVIELDRDPFVEWAKYTFFGAKKHSDKKFMSSRYALFRLDMLIKNL